MYSSKEIDVSLPELGFFAAFCSGSSSR
ncbi:hypothetical protein D049_0635A, partial [Vibrio parahaemolyticus VPTS-2010]